MPTIFLGPNDSTYLLKADALKRIHRINVDLTIDGAGTITRVDAYPVDRSYIEIKRADGTDFRIKGCPYPPDCEDINFIGPNPPAKVEECSLAIKIIDADMGIL